MKHRAAIWRLTALGLLLALLLMPSLALAAPAGDACRRLDNAGEINRRCAQTSASDSATECRRVWGTDDWTGRCAHACRRLVNAGEWTRRCLPVFPGGPGGE